MALPAATSVPLPSPQVVGIAFVEQYYQILHQSPEIVYKFYQESSTFSRPNSDGVMTCVTTTSAINDVILSLDYKDYIAEIITVDSQPSYNEGVFILVTGLLTGMNKTPRKFTQSFFLAQQDKGVYFVLNDMFRFMDETKPMEINQILVNGSNEESPKSPLNLDPELDLVQDHHLVDSAVPPSEEISENGEDVCSLSENGDAIVEQEVAAVDAPIPHSEQQPISEASSSVVQEDAPKKSYASIVSKSPAPVYVPTAKKTPVCVNPEKPLTTSEKPSAPSTKPAPALETSSTGSNSVSLKNSSHDVEALEGYSIHVRNLPLESTADQVEAEFKKFGPIKPGGVQVRSNKTGPFCFGFVEFESMNSMQAALQASPILIGGRQAYVAEKRTLTRVTNGVVINGNNGGGRGRYLPVRGGFRNENFRGRGGFVGNQGFGRSDFRGRGEYQVRGRGQGEYQVRGRGQGYQQRAFQNGSGRTSRTTAVSQEAVTA